MLLVRGAGIPTLLFVRERGSYFTIGPSAGCLHYILGQGVVGAKLATLGGQGCTWVDALLVRA